MLLSTALSRATMTKLLAYLLQIDTINCVEIARDVIDTILVMQPKVPVNVLFHEDLCIGQTVSFTRKDLNEIEVVFIFNNTITPPDGSVELILNPCLRVKQSHTDGDITIIDNAELLSLGLFPRRPVASLIALKE